MLTFCVRYHVSKPHEYLVITGAGIKDVAIKKTAFVMPMQRVRVAPTCDM
jgi:flotillin